MWVRFTTTSAVRILLPVETVETIWVRHSELVVIAGERGVETFVEETCFPATGKISHMEKGYVVGSMARLALLLYSAVKDNWEAVVEVTVCCSQKLILFISNYYY